MFIEDMKERYILARWFYKMGEPFLSDPEYDRLEKDFKLEYPESSYSQLSWSLDDCPVELLKKYHREDLIQQVVMGYAAESIYSINNESEFNQTFRGLNKRSRLSFKIDGWNTRVSYYNGVIAKVESRGRSGNNLSMNNIARLFPKKIPFKGRVAVTGELSIPNKLWLEFKELTGNADQRASVRTALARSAVEYLAFCAFNLFIEDDPYTGDQYELLNKLGFTTPRFYWVNNFEELKKTMAYMSYINVAYDFLTDGLVIENEDIQLAIRLGAWEEKVFKSYVTSYEESQGMYGTFLKVNCYPIIVGGKTFSKISINNVASILENNLRIGYPIAFNKRSEANVVIDTTATMQLQRTWANDLQGYQLKIQQEQKQ